MSFDHSTLINKIASKLEIGDPNVLTKACTYLQIYQSKSQISMNEMTKMIICLDIAAAQLGVDFSKASALKFAVLTKAQYQKHYLYVKNILQVDAQKSIREICVQLSCEPAGQMSEKLLNLYKENDHLDRDFNHPQYGVMAVYIVCRLNNISVKKSSFLALSTLKSQQWQKLEQEFRKFAEKHNFKMILGKKTEKSGNDFMNIIEETTKMIEADDKSSKIIENVKKIESYEEWRKRILDEAYYQISLL